MQDLGVLPIDEVVTAFYLRLQVADETGVLARITGILAEHGISIDALLQRPNAAGAGEPRTDVIILTHDTVEGRMTRGDRQDAGAADGAGEDRPHSQGRPGVKYLSTRGEARRRGFAEILLEGLAPDGGLYVPERYPRVDAATLAAWRRLSYPELAFEVMSLFIDDIPAADLRTLVDRSYTAEVFGDDPRIVPLRPLEPGVFVLALSNGPTLAFKDVAMQFLGQAFDTSSRGVAAAQRPRRDLGRYRQRRRVRAQGKRGIEVFMLSPLGRMSPFQQAQMFSLQDANIHNIAVEGVFDDCQDLVKAVSADLDSSVRTRSAPSTRSTGRACWRRSSTTSPATSRRRRRRRARSTSPCRPATSATSAPATSRAAWACRSGWSSRPTRTTCSTSSSAPASTACAAPPRRTRPRARRWTSRRPRTSSGSCSMRSAATRRARARSSARSRRERAFALDAAERERIAGFGFVSGRSTSADRLATIRDVDRRFAEVIDPHTADALKVGREHADPAVPMVVCETAQAAKFNDTVRAAIGRDAPRPAHLVGLEALPRRFTTMAPDLARLKALIAENR